MALSISDIITENDAAYFHKSSLLPLLDRLSGLNWMLKQHPQLYLNLHAIREVTVRYGKPQLFTP